MLEARRKRRLKGDSRRAIEGLMTVHGLYCELHSIRLSSVGL
jgi:hypothetical protein